jgi:hypothetical protein
MKKITNRHALRKEVFLKFLRIMRLSIACMLIACLHAAATGHSQDRVTLHLKSGELRKALIAIE